jgi:methionyl-tRNA formyltransferase
MDTAVHSPSYIVAGNRPWTRRVFGEVISGYPGRWLYADKPKQLSLRLSEEQHPRYIFFMHWSWKVPQDLLEKHECICFHMTDVPYGRGGSPLQNLILRGHQRTKLTALRMEEDLDAGPVYLQEDLCLEGNAEEIYMRAARLSADMIGRIIVQRPNPVPQRGEVTTFTRRRPAQSEIPDRDSLEALHDFVRMLDADGYPRAFLDHRGFRYEFSRAALRNGRILADVSITPMDRDQR